MIERVETEVRRGRKFEQVLEGARRIFLRDGFEGASVDEIARAAGVSKATLYSYFPDKRLLFIQIFVEEFRHRGNEARAEADQNAPARKRLDDVAHRIGDFLMSEYGREMFRLMLAEINRFPDVARVFYRKGIQQLHDLLVTMLRDLARRGELEIPDYDLAADQFCQLCKAYIHDRLIFGLEDEVSPEEVEASLKGAVDMFLARYGVGRALP